HFALVRVELPLRDPTVAEKRIEEFGKPVDDGAQPRRIATKAHAQVILRIVVAEEEPSFGGAALHGPRGERRDRVAQNDVGGGGAGVELEVQPGRGRREDTRGLVAERPGLAPRRRAMPREREHQLVGKPSFRSAYRQRAVAGP